MTSAVVDRGGSVVELSSNGVENQEESEKVSEYPAVIVEPVPSARLEQGYAAQVLVYDDETYMMQDVAEEQEVETENVETGRHLIKYSLLLTFSYYCQMNDILKNFLMQFSSSWKPMKTLCLREFIYLTSFRYKRVSLWTSLLIMASL